MGKIGVPKRRLLAVLSAVNVDVQGRPLLFSRQGVVISADAKPPVNQ